MEESCCDDWEPQIKKVNGPILLQSARAGRSLYDGIPFRFCPWCGRRRGDSWRMDDETFLKRAIEEDSQPIGVGAPPTNDRGPEGEAAELLPCPFCGAGGCLVQTEDIYYVQCSDCYAESDVRSVKESAVIVWNRRASPSSAALVAARVEEREQCAVIADIEKRKGISNLNSDNDDSDYDEGYTEAAQFIAMTIRALEQVKEEKQNAKG